MAAIDLGDLHRSSGISRALGPDHADALVSASRQLLRHSLGDGIRLFLVSADCFACILPDGCGDVAERLLQPLRERFRAPLEYEGVPGMISPSAGLVRFRAGEANGRGLLRAAMAAAQDARRSDRMWLLRDSTAEYDTLRVPALLRGLRPALASPDQLSLLYQPRVDMRSGQYRSAEALLRWHHPTLGEILPGEFIPLVEQTGMIGFVTDWVVERALCEWAGQSDAEAHSVSINVSTLNLGEPDFAAQLGQTLDRHGIEPHQVELELTETALLRDSEPVTKTVQDLATLGIGIAIDDFGTGYSNLFYLRETPATTVKIDQSFIRPLCDSHRDQIIVQSMIQMAHDLGYRVVAEGIESREAYDMLAEWGCDEGQGFHISYPVPISALAN